MSGIIKWAVVIVAWIGAVWITGHIIGKEREKAYAKRHEREFYLMCQAVAATIASKTSSLNESQIMSYVALNLKTYDYYNADPELKKCLDENNYLRFTYLSAIRSAQEWQTDLKEFCESAVKLKVGKELEKEKKADPYLVSFTVWAVLGTIVLEVLAEHIF